MSTHEPECPIGRLAIGFHPGCLCSPLRLAYLRGRAIERSKTNRYLRQRVADLKSCSKPDECSSVARVIQGCIDDLGEQ